MLFVGWRAVPVEVEAPEDYPSGVKGVVFESLLLDEAVEGDAAVLVLGGVIRGHLVAVVVLLRGALVLDLPSRLLFRERCPLFDWVKELDDVVQVYVHLLLLRGNTSEAHLAKSHAEARLRSAIGL